MDNKRANTGDKIEIQGMDFFYGQKQAIYQLDLEIRAKQILSVIGPANSGITTLLDRSTASTS